MDIAIIAIVILLIILLFKRFDNTVMIFGVLDIIFRIINFIGNNTIIELKNFINKYIPSSIEGIIRNYSSGTLEDILIWIYVFFMGLFCYFVLKKLIKRI